MDICKVCFGSKIIFDLGLNSLLVCVIFCGLG